MTKPWADQPFAPIPTPTETQKEGLSKEVIWVATEMCLSHNMLILNLNAIILQCEQVTEPKDIKDFVIFCQTSVEEIQHHHMMEEKTLFPWIAEYTGEKDIMESNIEEHHGFEALLKTLETYLYAATPENYDAKQLKKMVEEFGEQLVPHLSHEIPTLLGLEKYGGKPLGVVYERFNKQILASIGDKSRVLPNGLGAIDKSFEGGKHNFPPFPFFVPYLGQYIFGRKYRGSWRFSPCTMFGEKRELAFAKDE